MKRFLSLTSSLLVAGSFFFAITSCTKKANDNEILLGSYSSNTGATGSFGILQKQGIDMAVEEINAKGGIKGKKINLINYDNKSENDETLAVVNRLVSQDNVLAIIGETTSGKSKIGAQIAQANKVVMLSPSATNPDVTKVGTYIFRACFIDPFQGKVMAKFMTENLKFKKAAILRDVKSDYSVGLSDVFAGEVKGMDGEIVADVSYQEGDIDFKSQLTAIKSKKPDVIFVPGYYNEVALLAKQLKELGMTQILLGGDGWSSPKLYEIAKEAMNGHYFSNHYTTESTDPKTVEFVKNYKAKHKEDPDVMAALGYDAVYLLVEAIKNTKELNRETIREELSKIKDFAGVTGKMSMDENRNAVKSAVVVKTVGPEYKFITSVNP